MKRREKIACAMSGGIDSSVAAALLFNAGYEVIGITMNIWPEEVTGSSGESAISDAAHIAEQIGIPHYVFDVSHKFKEEVIDSFISEYIHGRTPNPCVTCNPAIKFGLLAQEAYKLGAVSLATGHYARIEYDDTHQRYLLKKGKDQKKDQSYFLYKLNQEQLSRTLFPLGNLTKDEVRLKAVELGLTIANKEESQEVCFIPDNDYHAFIYKYGANISMQGPIYDTGGRLLGQHKGISNYTVGQRQGLGISWSEPLYVLKINTIDNSIIVGVRDELLKNELIAYDPNWIAMGELRESMNVSAKIRYKSKEAPACIYPEENNKVRVHFKEPQSAITPGQAVVFYDNDAVVGGATIERSL